MRLVDLSGPATARRNIAVEIIATPATELLLSTLAVLNEAPDEFDIGAGRLEALAEVAGPELIADLQNLIGDGPKLMMMLLPVLADVEDPTDVDGLLAELRSFDPSELWAIIMAHFADGWADATEDTIRRASQGDETSRTVLRDAACNDDSCPAFIRLLLDTNTTELHAGVVDVLGRWRDAVLPNLEHEGLAAMQRDAAAKRALAGEVDLAELVLTATNGLEWTSDPRIRRVLLLPSYVFRPWVVVTEWGGTRVIAYPVADEHLALPSSAPPPSLVKLFKSLGDEGRLRLLQRMRSGPISLTEAATELDVSKPTAHHHLAILRQAGLVTISEQGRTKNYALRSDPPEQAQDGLSRYLAAADQPTAENAGSA